MADSDSSAELFDLWRKQVEASTEAWSKAAEQMAGGNKQASKIPDPEQIWRQFMDPGAAAWARLQSAGPIDPEVLAQWKRFLDDWIAAWSKVLEKAMGTDEFAAALGKTLDQFLTVHGKAKEAAEKTSKATLETLGLPSRDQVIGLSRQLMDLEDRLEALEDKLETPGSGQTKAPRATAPKATKAAKRTRPVKKTRAKATVKKTRAKAASAGRKTSKKRRASKS